MVVAYSRTIFEMMLSGRLNRDDPNAQGIAHRALQDIRSIENQFDDVLDNRRIFGEAYLKDGNIIFYWTRTFSFMVQITNMTSDDEASVTHINQQLTRLATQMSDLEQPLLNAAAGGCLDIDALSLIGERWSRLDAMVETHADQVVALRSLKRWFVSPWWGITYEANVLIPRDEVLRQVQGLLIQDAPVSVNSGPTLPLNQVKAYDTPLPRDLLTAPR